MPKFKNYTDAFIEEEDEEEELDEDLEHGEDLGIEEDLDPDETDDDDTELEESDEDDDEDEPDEPDEVDDRRPVKQTRAQDRIRKLNAERKQARAEADALKQQLATITQQNQQRTNTVDPAAEAAFRASLSPEELIRYDVNKVLQAQQQQTRVMQFNIQDMMDKQVFQSIAANNPLYAKLAPQVETKLANLRAQGMNVPREEILKHIIGERVLSGKAKTVSRDKAKANVKKNKIKSSSNKSDFSREAARSGNERDQRRKRLENVTF